jgi:hypothetical protein
MFKVWVVPFTLRDTAFFIVHEVSKSPEIVLLTAAETYAKAGIAQREARIICFVSKYKTGNLHSDINTRSDPLPYRGRGFFHFGNANLLHRINVYLVGELTA